MNLRNLGFIYNFFSDFIKYLKNILILFKNILI